jgi:hypothetical protein
MSRICIAQDDTGRRAGFEPLTKTWVSQRPGTGNYPEFDFGGSVRLRYVDFENAISLGDTSDPFSHWRFLRLRSRLWFDYRFSPTTRAYLRLNNESRKYFDPEALDSRFDEIIFENLYLEITDLFGLPVGTRIGRQDLFYGDGFVICDGGALDGSRTSYVNALLLSSSIPLWSFDMFVASNPEKDEYLPRINNRYNRLLEIDEFVAGLFLRRRPSDGAPLRYTFEPYYVYKTESAPDSTSRVHTFGACVTFPLYRFKASAEFAYQGGKAPESNLENASIVQRPQIEGPQSISAFGGWARLAMSITSPVPVQVTGGYVYLSGDDRTTRNKYEGWNPVLGRWPLWSELYIYTLLMERDAHPMRQSIAYWQNLDMPYIQVRVQPHRAIDLEGKYLWMYADEAVFADPRADLSTKRGDLISIRAGWRLFKGLGGHVLYEKFRPGSFYDTLPVELYPDGAADAEFFRIELHGSF